MKKKLGLFFYAILGVFTIASCANDNASKSTSTKQSTNITNPNSNQEESNNNMIQNGDFSETPERYTASNWYGIGAWNLNEMQGGKGEINIVNGELKVTINNFGKTEYAIQVNQKGIEIASDVNYLVSFDIRADEPQMCEAMVQQDYSPYSPYYKKSFEIQKTNTHVEETFTSKATDKKVSFVFNLGVQAGYNLNTNNVYIDNVYLFPTDPSQIAKETTVNILVNQIGYNINSKKEAILRGNEIDSKFEIINVETNTKVYEGKINQAKSYDGYSVKYSKIDFSDFKEAGKYKIHTEKLGDSYTFEIKDNVYSGLTTSAIEMLYTQRCGMDITSETCNHKACHLEKAYEYSDIYLENPIDVSGGWHDAGDYGKYVVPGAKTVQDLLLSYELFGDFYHNDKVNTNDNIPDILEEAIYELDFLLKMQKSNGEVYHKVTTKEFPATNIMPEEDTKPLYLTATSYAATGDFAAIMASASRVLKDIDHARSETYLEASKKAYTALKAMQAKSYKNERTISTGEYPDDKLNDELAWAQIELYRATMNETFVNDYLNTYQKSSLSIGYGWDNVYGYAIYSYLKSGHDSSSKASMLKLMKDVKSSFVERMNNNPVSSPIGLVYEWGSNMAICNYAMCAILLNDIEDQEDTINIVNSLLNYLLGINNTTYCYVTGFGSKSPENPHHRPSVAKDEAVKGMLVGGPNSDFENNGGDTIATTKLKDKNPDECYIDNENSWSTNEVTIYWNSPLIFMLGYIQ